MQTEHTPNGLSATKAHQKEIARLTANVRRAHRSDSPRAVHWISQLAKTRCESRPAPTLQEVKALEKNFKRAAKLGRPSTEKWFNELQDARRRFAAAGSAA